MKKLLLLSALLCATVQLSLAQPGFHESIQKSRRDLTSVLGRDFWFQIPGMNPADSSRSYILHVSSDKPTTAHLQIGSEYDTTLSLSALVVDTIRIPLEWELQSSGVVENKGIHLWSDSADLVAIVIGSSKFGAGALHPIPSFGLGNDYVVAACGALEGYSFGNNNDFPSEFTITAEHDGTSIQITPSVPLRKESSYGSNKATYAEHPIGQPFSLTLDKGMTVQFRSVWGTNPLVHSYDVTGTVVHSNMPIAVSGGSMYTAVPISFTDGGTQSYVCGMNPPIRAWGKTYYTASFPEPSRAPAYYDSSMYLFIASKANQTIYQFNNIVGGHAVCTIPVKYGASWNEQTSDQKFWSDAPFLLVQYMNGNSYPDGYGDAYGGPAMSVIPPADDFGSTGSFIVPVATNPKYPFWEHVNLLSNDNAQDITIDDKPMMNDTSQYIDDTVTNYRVANLAPGIHTIHSPRGVGAYCYGYGNGTIAYPANNGTIAAAGGRDTTSPSIAFSIFGDSLQAIIADTESGLATIFLDSSYNVRFITDTTFIPGDSLKAASLYVQPADTSSAAFIRFIIYDMAGNRSAGTVLFTPGTPGVLHDFTALASSFDSVLVDTSKTFAAITMKDSSSVNTVTIDSIWTDNPAFTYNAASPASNILPIVLGPGNQCSLFVTFTPRAPVPYSGHLFIRGIGNSVISVPLSGIGYTVLASVSNGISSMNATIIPENDGHSLEIILPSTINSQVTFELVNVLGERVLDEAIINNEHVVNASTLPRGMYFYKLTSGLWSQSGKVILGE